MPLYEYFCQQCQREVTISMSISQHDKGEASCPQCGERRLQPLVGTFFAKTSRKS